MIKAIVCVGKNWEIGKNNSLLFNIKADMKMFREQTKNSIVVCGKNTLLSFPNSKPLKDRLNIVLCSEGTNFDGCVCVHDLDKLVKMIQAFSLANTVWVIGGAMLYDALVPYYDEILVTKVNATDPDATAFFPNIDALDTFEVSSESEVQTEGEYTFKFVTYTKK